MILKFSPGEMDKYPQAFDVVAQSYLAQTVTYIIDWRYRKAIGLSNWIEKQVDNPTPAVLEFANSIPEGQNYDETMLNIRTYVNGKLTYLGDMQHWKADEYWATVDETLTGTSVVDGVTYGPMEGDCEDGAILIYVCARLKGIPASHLLIMAGQVVGGGHCWCAYRALEYPLNWVFMDWCYWPSSKDVYNRNMYYIKGQSIKGWLRNNDEIVGLDSNYQQLWFGFNEAEGYYRLDFALK